MELIPPELLRVTSYSLHVSQCAEESSRRFSHKAEAVAIDHHHHHTSSTTKPSSSIDEIPNHTAAAKSKKSQSKSNPKDQIMATPNHPSSSSSSNKHAYGECACGRNQFAVAIPPTATQHQTGAHVFFDNSRASRKPSFLPSRPKPMHPPYLTLTQFLTQPSFSSQAVHKQHPSQPGSASL